MKYLIKILEDLQRRPWIKYVVVIALSVIMIGFVDENSVWHHYRNQSRIAELRAEIRQLKRQHLRDSLQVLMLNKDPKTIEKIARERYFMKEDDEDTYPTDRVREDDEFYQYKDESEFAAAGYTLKENSDDDDLAVGDDEDEEEYGDEDLSFEDGLGDEE